MMQPGLQLFLTDYDKTTWFWYVRVNSITDGKILCDITNFYKDGVVDYTENTTADTDIDIKLKDYNIVTSIDELKILIRMLFS